MLTKDIAAVRIARAIAEAESAADELLQKIARLQSSMLEARLGLDVPRRAGQGALLRLGKANEQAIAATTAIHCVHAELLKTDESVRGLADQDGECPWPDTVGEHRLREVS